MSPRQEKVSRLDQEIARFEGARAYQEGVDIIQNPYVLPDPGSVSRHELWDQGWTDEHRKQGGGKLLIFLRKVFSKVL